MAPTAYLCSTTTDNIIMKRVWPSQEGSAKLNKAQASGMGKQACGQEPTISVQSAVTEWSTHSLWGWHLLGPKPRERPVNLSLLSASVISFLSVQRKEPCQFIQTNLEEILTSFWRLIHSVCSGQIHENDRHVATSRTWEIVTPESHHQSIN